MIPAAEPDPRFVPDPHEATTAVAPAVPAPESVAPDPAEATTTVMPVAAPDPEPEAEPEPETQSETEPQREETDEEQWLDPLKGQLLEVSSGVVGSARDYREAELDALTTQRGFKGLLKRIWYGNIAREAVGQRLDQRARAGIVESRDLGAMRDDSSHADHTAEMAAAVTRVANGFLENGEQQQQLAEIEGGEAVERQLRVLVNFYAQEVIEADEFDEARTRVLDDFRRELHQADRDKGLLLADNLLEVAQAARAAFRHGIAAERIQEALRFDMGDARIGARTEAQRTRTDRIIDRLHGTRIGSLVNETTLSVGVGIAASVIKFTTGKATTAGAAVLGMGVGAGLVAGAREHAHIGRQRAQHARERATGQELGDASGRQRERLEETRYNTVGATALTDQLTEARAAVDAADPASIAQAVQIISEAETRIEMSGARSIDLIDFSGATNIERERLALSMAVAEARVAANRGLRDADETALTDAGLSRDLDAMVANYGENVHDLIETDISGKDRAFNRLRRSQTLKMAGIGAVSGVAIGTMIQEVRGVVSDEMQGVFDGSNGSDRRTMLAGLLGHQGAAHAQLGHLTEQHFTTSHVVHEHVQRTVHEYLHHHPNEFTKVHRELWYDNNTPDTFDQNELKLWWGANGTGVDAHGNYVFNVAQMTPDGSFHDGLSTDAQHLVHKGKMAIALSMTQGTQSHVIMVPIDRHGNAIIHADSWMAKSLFDTKDGHARFTGAYAEAVQLMGKHHGVESMRMLATAVGEGHPKHITDTISHIVHEQHERIVSSPGESPIEVPPILPIYGRRGLEKLEQTGPEITYAGGYIVDGYRASEGLIPRAGLAPFAPELQADPDAKIDSTKAAKRYVKAMRPRYKRVVDSLADELDDEPKADRPKVVIMIPAAAHQEGKNIYNTLLQYSLQEDVASDDFEVVVFANYPKGQKPDDTISEVERFQAEHPDVKVRLLRKELEQHEAKIDWIRKALADSVIVDLVERGVSLDEVLLASNDADAERISPTYIKTIIDRAAETPEADGFLGFIDWGHEGFKAHPDMMIGFRFMQMLDIYNRVAKHQAGSSGANFVFRPGMYAAIGGYPPIESETAGEDRELGLRINSIRAGATGRQPIVFLGRRGSEIVTSPRRAIETLLERGGAPATQWRQFGVNDELRSRDFDLRPFDFDNPAAVETMVRSCESLLNQTLKTYGVTPGSGQPTYHAGRLTGLDVETIRQINRIGFFLGLQFAWQPDGTLEITDAERMIKGMREWQATH